MPLFSKHSNRSKHALDESGAGTATTSTTSTTTTTTSTTTPSSPATPASALGKTDEARATTQPDPSFALMQQRPPPPPQQHQQPHSQHLPPSQHPQHQQQASLRRTSQPYAGVTSATPIDTGSPTIDYPHPGTLVRPQSTYSSPFPQLVPVSDRRSVDDLALATPRTQLASPPKSQTSSPVVEPKKSRGLFDRMRSSSRTPDANNPSTPAQGSALAPGHGRRLSRRLQNPPAIRTSSTASPDKLQHLDWQTAPGPRSYLPSPQEHAEDRHDLDPYLVQELERAETRSSNQEQSQQHTIRSVPSDLEQEPSGYSTQDDNPSEHLSLIQALQQPQLEVPQNNHHPGPAQGQQLSPYPDALGISHDPYSQNFETVSQLSFDTSAEQREDIPVSEHSNTNSPTSNANSLRSEHSNNRSAPPSQRQRERDAPPYNTMAPGGTSQQPRRTADPKQAMQANSSQPDARDGGNYRQPFTGSSTPTTVPSTSPLPTGPGNEYRGGPPQREQFAGGSGGERGRSTPPPAAERDVNDAYKEILQKYKKVKGLYFDKTAQVEQLQNSLAHQRLSQSRTSLDDNEYMTRFQRLDGATTNLAFNIRKNWRSIPNWLAPSVNQDALQVGKQEMTAVGRAFISRFLIEEVFNKTFHPGLENNFSSQLKLIEQNIRRFAPALNNQEESDALTAKVVQWRLATLDGLREVLQSAESQEHQKQFARVATSNLAASLVNFLSEPIPNGIADSAHMIIELAVNIACNLPLESRDIAIMYPLPGDLLQPSFMKVESGGGMPPLENPGGDATGDVDGSSTASGDKDDTGKEGEKSDGGKLRKERPNKSGMLQPGSKKSAQNTPDTPSEAKGKQSEDGAQKVRFAGFLGVEVRGRQMLAKAPVWTVS